MPIYEYECAKCGEFEVNQRITDEPLKRCPKCRSKIRKLISNTSFQLKGSGWYVTDYARSSSGAKAGESKGGESKTTESSSSDSGKADSKADSVSTTSKTDSGKSDTSSGAKSGKGSGAKAA